MTKAKLLKKMYRLKIAPKGIRITSSTTHAQLAAWFQENYVPPQGQTGKKAKCVELMKRFKNLYNAVTYGPCEGTNIPLL